MEGPSLIKKTDLVSFLKDQPSVVYIDDLESQLKALFLVKNPQMHIFGSARIFDSVEFKNFSKNIKSNLVFFPWLKKVVKIVNEEDYFLLKTSRNAPLINFDELKCIKKSRVALIGMSVGSNIAHALGLMGFSNMLLCDHDDLECVNFNRLLGGIDETGINKAELVARRLYGNNPYAKLDVLAMKITTDLLDQQHNQEQIQVIVEEIDSLDMKIDIRRWAKQRGVAVVMLTSNVHGLILDVERYDLDRTITILGRTEKFWYNIMKKSDGSMEQRLKMVNAIVGKNVMDNRMRSALSEIGKTIITWPQLISAGMLEGSIGVATLLNIATGRDKEKCYRRVIHTID